MVSHIPKKALFLLLVAPMAVLFALVLSSDAYARQDTASALFDDPPIPIRPVVADAYAYITPQAGGPPSGGTVNVGAKFTLDLKINAGSNDGLTAQQSYFVFDTSVLQVVDPAGSGCNPITTITHDPTVFDVALQNELCNGPNPCVIRGITVGPGWLAYASGALNNCPEGCNNDDFRVASITFCATGGTVPGQPTRLRWQFSPPDPPTRDCQIITLNGDLIHNRDLYREYTLNVTGPTSTPVPNRTPFYTPTPFSTPTCQIAFTDVHPTDYFYQAVLYLYCRGVVTGYPDNTFRPYNNTTRAQLCKIVVLAEGWIILDPKNPTFIDVPRDHTFYTFIETAHEQGVVSGYADNTFRPGSDVTRGQLCKIIVLAERWSINTQGGPHFIDVAENYLFYPFIETAYNYGVVSGYSDNTFRPGGSATRGQICKIVYYSLTLRSRGTNNSSLP